MPLYVEVHSENTWKAVRTLRSGDTPGSVSDNKPDGSRDVYIFECKPDDSESTISKSEIGVDASIGITRIIESTNMQIVATLKQGDPPHEMSIKRDNTGTTVRIRFTHKKAS